MQLVMSIAVLQEAVTMRSVTWATMEIWGLTGTPGVVAQYAAGRSCQSGSLLPRAQPQC